MHENNPYQAPRASFNASADEGDWDNTPVYSPSGRFGRLSYLAWNGLVYFAFSILMVALGPIFFPENLSMDYLLGQGFAMFTIMTLPLQAIYILFSIRRFHDINMSGWWCIALLIPLVNAILGLVLVFMAGTDGANDYGPPRMTQPWEKVLGILYIAIMVIGVFAMVALFGILASNGLPSS